MNKRPIEEVDNSTQNDKEVQVKKSKLNFDDQAENEKNQNYDLHDDDDDSNDEVDIEIDNGLINKINEDAKEFTFVDDENENYDDSGDEENLDDEDEFEHKLNLREIKDLQNQNISTKLISSSLIQEFIDENGDLIQIDKQENSNQLNQNHSKEEKDEKEEEEDEDTKKLKEIEEELTEDESIEIAAKSFLYKYIQDKKDLGMDPIEFTKSLGFKLEIKDEDIWKIITSFLTRRKIAVMLFLNYLKYNSFMRPYRKKLGTINNFEDVMNLFLKCNNIMIITGAGVSVSSGIPDFRSKGGIYESIEKKYNLPKPESLFDINYLQLDPRPFFEFAREIYPGVHKPTPTHHFIKRLDTMGKLLRNYTQNIDTLEHVVGIDQEKLVNCHGSFSTATCIKCKHRVTAEDIKESIMKTEIPLCLLCNDSISFMKPDIVFFGENLPDRFDQCVNQDLPRVDLVVVIGSSLKVQPVALLPEIIDQSIPQILVNREIVAQPHEFDYVYLGDCDSFVNELNSKIGWDICNN